MNARVKIKSMISAAQADFAFTQHGIDPAKLRQLLELRSTNDVGDIPTFDITDTMYY